MPRRLVVECEPGLRAIVPDGAKALSDRMPCERRWRFTRGSRRARRVAVGRPHRVAREGVLDVGEQELLVLLLVMETERDREVELGDIVGPREPSEHRLVDVRAVALHLGEARTREQTALGPRVSLA